MRTDSPGEAMRDAAPSKPPRSKRARRVLLYGLYCAVASYALAEILYTTLYVLEVIQPPSAVDNAYIIEDNGGSSDFDPICGIRLSPIPCRHARISNGKFEYTGIIRGNNQGFPDRDDFGPERTDPQRPRVAIMGDSFTAAPFLERSWPDVIEDAAREAGTPIELLNCSVNGGGITNWWSIVIRYLQPRNYQLDGLLFAVFDYDFDRGFFIADHHAYGQALCGYVSTNFPQTWPKTLEAARPYFQRDEGILLSPRDFDRALEGKWHPGPPRTWRPYLGIKLLKYGGEAVQKVGSALFSMPKAMAQMPPPNEEFQQDIPEKIDEMAAYARANSIPIMVVRLPTREALIEGSPCPVIIKKFATRVGATLVDGAAAFAGLNEPQVRENWLPVDGHWNQMGSDRFAAYFRPILLDWVQTSRGSPSQH